MTTGEAAAVRKVHASLNVSDLDRSVGFYRVLLGQPPVKQRGNYAKFELGDPRWCSRSNRPR
jgi:catechol 2,3-dioxygenase-like lactoylglutathione lyase family enzyme